MNNQVPQSMKHIVKTARKDVKFELKIVEASIPVPSENEVLVQIEASPINPSDIGRMLGMVNLDTLHNPDRDHVVAEYHEAYREIALQMQNPDEEVLFGGEGAGTVVAAGNAAKHLIGRTVSFRSGTAYSQYRAIPLSNVIVHKNGVTSREAASASINPLTALGMVETMRREGHSALVHTAAASSLGQMLLRLCQDEGVELVTIVRSEAQTKLLEKQGAQYVVNSTAPTFFDDLVKALTATGATIGFDAVGGGELAGTIIEAMEAALVNRRGDTRSVYGTNTHKQVYIYGGLDVSPSVISRRAGMAWGVGGWLLPSFLESIGVEATEVLKARVSNNIRTIFGSTYTKELALSDVLSADVIRQYTKQATGEKYLIRPQK